MSALLPLGACRVPTATDLEGPPLGQNLTDVGWYNGVDPPGDPHDLINGAFAVSDPDSSEFGWTLRGDALVGGGHGVLGETGPLNAGLAQTFLVPDGAKYLRFDVVDLDLHATASDPPDAFEVALLVDDSGPTGINVAYDETQGSLALTGIGTWETYEAMLSFLRYHNVSHTPDPESRRVTVSINDGCSDSDAAIAWVTVIPSNCSISGYVYVDVNNDGVKGDPESPLPNIPITLTGPVTRTVVTAADGSYHFGDSPHGTYSVTETQPLAFRDGMETPGSPVPCDLADNGFFDLAMLSVEVAAAVNDFGERGLRAELITKQLLSSTPTGNELLRHLDVMGGKGWYGFESEQDGAVRVSMAEGVRDPFIEIYGPGWTPVVLSHGASEVSAPVGEDQAYAIYVAGEGLKRAELEMISEESIPQRCMNRRLKFSQVSDFIASNALRQATLRLHIL